MSDENSTDFRSNSILNEHEHRDRSKRPTGDYLEWIRNSANWICSGVPEIVTCRSCEPSSKSAILIFAPDACLARRRGLDERRWRRQTYRISEIFCPPRPMIQPIRSLAMVISRWVWMVGRFPGRPLGIRGAGSKGREEFCSQGLQLSTEGNLPAGRGTPGPSWANGP